MVDKTELKRLCETFAKYEKIFTVGIKAQLAEQR
jgi:hypothetical protein